MGAVGVGLLIEEHRVEIHEVWTETVRKELSGEAALEFAVGPLLRELSLGLRGDVHRLGAPRPDPQGRCAVLIRSAASPARVAREFKVLHRVLWQTLRDAGCVVPADERRVAEEWLHEALAAALERLERIRSRMELLEHPPVVAPARAAAGPARPQPSPPSGQRPPPLPWARARTAAATPPSAAAGKHPLH